MGEVLGKLKSRSLNETRGPDVLHSIRVPVEWLEQGETIEVDLPRNLACANCEGGGCDQCERAGAVSLRERDAPPETLKVSLPSRSSETVRQPLLLRIPERGGFSRSEQEPRGLLMLRVNGAPEPDDGIRLVDVATPRRELRAPPEVVVRSLVFAVLLILAFIWIMRLSGWF